MKAEDIRRRLAELALDTNEYRINAGGAMVLHGLREETHDLDIWCTKKLGDALAQRLQHAQLAQQLALHGAFAAGENDTVDTGQSSFFSYFDTGDPELFQHMFMLDESTLYGKYGDGHFYLPRSSIMI